MTTLPPAFCGSVRDVHLKRQSQFKIFEWMALLHWYLVPMFLELKLDFAMIQNFAQFVYIVEYSMTIVERSEKNLTDLHSIIANFLTTYEKLYVNNNPKNVSRCRLCLFQLIHIPAHIRWNGSVRLGSQATVERAIGNLGSRIHSQKAPFANLTRLVKEIEFIKILKLYYPQLATRGAPYPPNPSSVNMENLIKLFSRQPPHTKQKLQGDMVHQTLKTELDAVARWLGCSNIQQDRYERWGKLRLTNGYVLRSAIYEVPEIPKKRNYRWFKAQGNNIFGEAQAFYHVKNVKRGSQELETEELVVYKPLTGITTPFGVAIKGCWNNDLQVIRISQIVTIVGICRVPNVEHTYILQKHPGLEMLMQHMPDRAEIELSMEDTAETEE